MENCEVLVLLATYNGEKFVREMIDSVINQDFDSFHIVLSDDGSSDSTADILDEYAEKYPELITHYRSGKKFGNAQNHFMHLAEKFHNAPYIMFCDQDDVWHSDKIRKTYIKMTEVEKDKNLPAMVHTDLRVVNGEMKVIDDSFMHFSKLDGSRMALNQLLMQNVVTGCTMMINRALAEKAVDNIPQSGILMHDWWLALIASAYGQTGFLNEATIDYRQHGNNVVGAKNTRSFGYVLKKIRNNEASQAIRKTFLQAAAFYSVFAGSLPFESEQIIKEFAQMKEDSLVVRRFKYIKYGFYKCGLTRVIGQFIWG